MYALTVLPTIQGCMPSNFDRLLDQLVFTSYPNDTLFNEIIRLLQSSSNYFGLKCEDIGAYGEQVPEYEDSDDSRIAVEEDKLSIDVLEVSLRNIVIKSEDCTVSYIHPQSVTIFFHIIFLVATKEAKIDRDITQIEMFLEIGEFGSAKNHYTLDYNSANVNYVDLYMIQR